MGKGSSKGYPIDCDSSTGGELSIAASNGGWFVDALTFGAKDFDGVKSDFVLESNWQYRLIAALY